MPRNLSAWIDLSIHLLIMLVLIGVLSYYNIYIAAIAGLVWLALASFARERCADRSRRFERYCRNVVRNINEMLNYAVDELPQAIMIVNEDGRIQWCNDRMGVYFGTKPEQDTDVKDLLPGIIVAPIWGQEGEYVFANSDKYYHVYYHPVQMAPRQEPLMTLYIQDVTSHEQLKTTYQQSRTVLVYIQIDRYEKLRLLSNYCDNRQHVEGYEHWDSLISNFGQLLKDILNLFDAHSRLEGETQYRFQHFYNDIRPYNHEKAEEALNEYKAEIWLIADLTFELTRLCNLILDNIREIVPDFCIEAGVLKIEEAKDKNNCDTIIEYEKTQKSDSPYPGLEAFLIERSNRRHVYDVSSDSNWLRQVLIKDLVLR